MAKTDARKSMYVYRHHNFVQKHLFPYIFPPVYATTTIKRQLHNNINLF